MQQVKVFSLPPLLSDSESSAALCPSVTSAEPKPDPLAEHVFWLGVLGLQMQTVVYTLNYSKAKRLQRHSSTLIFVLPRHASPHAFDAAPFQSKKRHEFNIATVYLG